MYCLATERRKTANGRTDCFLSFVGHLYCMILFKTRGPETCFANPKMSYMTKLYTVPAPVNMSREETGVHKQDSKQHKLKI